MQKSPSTRLYRIKPSKQANRVYLSVTTRYSGYGRTADVADY